MKLIGDKDCGYSTVSSLKKLGEILPDKPAKSTKSDDLDDVTKTKTIKNKK